LDKGCEKIRERERDKEREIWKEKENKREVEYCGRREFFSRKINAGNEFGSSLLH